MAIAIILLVLCAVVWTYSALKKLRFRSFAKKIGGPRGWPVIGVLHRVVSMKDLLYTLPTFTGESKSAFFWLATKPVFYTYDPTKIEKILNSPECINKSRIYDTIDVELGRAIMTSKSPTWEKHRKLLNPCFSHKILLSFFSVFNEKSNEVLQEFDKLVGSGENDLWMLLQNFSIKTSYATIISEDASNSMRKDKTFMSHAERHLNIIFERSVQLLMRYDITYRYFTSYKLYQESKKIVCNFLQGALLKKLTEVEDKYKKDCNSNYGGQDESIDITKPKFNFADMVIDIYRKDLFSWEDVSNETYVFVAAAFETSATTLDNVLILLAMHPHYQEKLYEELESVFPEKNFNVNYEHLRDLVYMDMVIDETLRITPSVPLISRVVSKDANIGDDLFIPRDTMIIMDIFNVHRCEEFWGSNATKFDPDHFLPQNQSGRHGYAYIPFSKGTRNCIGWRYAKLFLKVALSRIIRNYRFSTSFRYEDLRCVQHLSLRYEVKPKLEIHRR